MIKAQVCDKIAYLTILGIVSMILIRTLRRDIAKYNQEDELVMTYNYIFIYNSEMCKGAGD